MEEPNSHYLEVVIDVLDYHPKQTSMPVRLVMPTWTPGSYLIREFSRNVLDVVAFDIDEDKALPSSKSAKNVWEVYQGESTNIRVKYRVYALSLTVDTSYVDNVHAIVNGASVFMYVEGLEHERATLTVIPAEGWKVVATGLSLAPDREEGAWTFVVPNYDVLVDSPIEVGNQRMHSFEVKGVKHEVSIYSQRDLDEENLVSDLKKIVESAIAVFSQIPYERYLFIVDFAGESYGGLEHLNSTHCIAPIYRLEPIQEYRQLLSLFSHEFFHAWNVKRMRPIGLGPFNYSSETYTRSLWIAEGVTSYYDDLLLKRSGIFSLGDYLDSLSFNINIMKSFAGSKWQSAQESSFDTWIKHYRQDENSQNVLSSYYVQGAIIAWMLDLEIMKSTASAKNLDDALRILWKTYVNENRGYRDEEFELICSAIIGKETTSEIFDARVRGRKAVDFERYLHYCGLKLVPKKPQSESGFLGVRVRPDAGKVIVSNVLSESPAQTCGLTSPDDIVAIDGLRMDSSKISWYVSNREPETPVNILVSRFGSLLELTAETVVKPVLEYRIVKEDSAADSQKLLFRGWLGEDWESEIKYEDYSASPGKKAFFDFI